MLDFNRVATTRNGKMVKNFTELHLRQTKKWVDLNVVAAFKTEKWSNLNRVTAVKTIHY